MVRATSKTSIERIKGRNICYEKCHAISCHYCDWYYRTCRWCAIPGAGSWPSPCARRCGHCGRRDPADYRYCRHDGNAQQKPPVIAGKKRCVLRAKAIISSIDAPPVPGILTCEHIYNCRLAEIVQCVSRTD